MSEDLFRSARRELSPSSQDRARIRGRIAAKLAAGAVAATVTSTTTKAAAASTAKTVTLGLVAKIVAPILVVGGAAAVVAPRVIAPAEGRVAVAIVVPAPARTAAAKLTDNAVREAARAEAPVQPPAAGADPSAVTGRRPVVKPSPAIASAEEVVLVAEIDAALRSGDAARATQLAADHERKFPHGLLVEEREGARVIAHCMSGSRSRATAFLAAHPRSPMRARIVAACGTLAE
jgi:hypothetical protein